MTTIDRHATPLFSGHKIEHNDMVVIVFHKRQSRWLAQYRDDQSGLPSVARKAGWPGDEVWIDNLGAGRPGLGFRRTKSLSVNVSFRPMPAAEIPM
jgi:hypothetical protein